MTLLDQIKADREERKIDPWAWRDVTYHQETMEAALLAAGDLADAADRMESELGCDDIGCMCETVRNTLAAFRSAIEVK